MKELDKKSMRAIKGGDDPIQDIIDEGLPPVGNGGSGNEEGDEDDGIIIL